MTKEASQILEIYLNGCWNVETKKTFGFQGPKNELIFLGTRRRFF